MHIYIQAVMNKTGRNYCIQWRSHGLFRRRTVQQGNVSACIPAVNLLIRLRTPGGRLPCLLLVNYYYLDRCFCITYQYVQVFDVGLYSDNVWIQYNCIFVTPHRGMDDDTTDQAFAELKTRHLGGWGVAQIAFGTGLAVYAMWVGILQPGFRKVPLKLQVPYIPASKAQVDNVMTLLRGRKGGLVDLGSGDGRIVLEAHRQGFTPAVGYELNPWLVRLSRFHAWRAGHHEKVSYQREDLWKVNLRDCKNITVFLAPSVLSLLQQKLQAELPDDALVVAGRFPFPDWTPCRIQGHGVDRAWAYNIQAQRHHTFKKNDNFTASDSKNTQSI